MARNMTCWGIGPKWWLITGFYCIPVVLLRVRYPALFDMDFLPRWLSFAIGISLVVIGLPLLVVSVRTAMAAFLQERLCTTGVFGLCRHPVYAAWVVFIIPGVVLMSDTWPALTIPPVMWAILRMLVRREEVYLAEKFGEAYLAYKRRIPAVLPIGPLLRK